MSRANELNNDDWNLITTALETAAVVLTNDRMRHLASDLRSTYSRAVCTQCDDYPADPRAEGLDSGLCGRCIQENKLASLCPEDFDDDSSQDWIVERAVMEMAKLWENAKKLREQVEREESYMAKGYSPYLTTIEIRNLMGWMEKNDDGSFTTYYYNPQDANE